MESLSKVNRNYFMGIAIILVILHHICLLCEREWNVDSFPFTWFYWGQIGVDIFLFASAYGCCASWENNAWWRYLLHRVERIYPQYFVFLLICLVWNYADSSILYKIKVVLCTMSGLATFYRFGVHIDWYIPSLIMMYLTLPFIYAGLKRANRGGQLIIITFVMLMIPLCLKQPPIYYAFVARFPVILCGMIAYINRKDIGFLVKLFSLAMILSLSTREDMVIHSMMVPLTLTALSVTSLDTMPLKEAFSFCGKHSLEIYLAQGIGYGCVISNICDNKWISVVVMVTVTIAVTYVFYLVQKGYNKLSERIQINIK